MKMHLVTMRVPNPMEPPLTQTHLKMRLRKRLRQRSVRPILLPLLPLRRRRLKLPEERLGVSRIFLLAACHSTLTKTGSHESLRSSESSLVLGSSWIERQVDLKGLPFSSCLKMYHDANRLLGLATSSTSMLKMPQRHMMP